MRIILNFIGENYISKLFDNKIDKNSLRLNKKIIKF